MKEIQNFLSYLRLKTVRNGYLRRIYDWLRHFPSQIAADSWRASPNPIQPQLFGGEHHHMVWPAASPRCRSFTPPLPFPEEVNTVSRHNGHR